MFGGFKCVLNERVGPSLTSRFFFSFQVPRMPKVINCCFFYASPLSLQVAVRIPESLPCFWCPPLRCSEDACREQLKALLCSMQFYLGAAYCSFWKYAFHLKTAFMAWTYLPGSWLILWPCCNYFYYYFYFYSMYLPWSSLTMCLSWSWLITWRKLSIFST